MKALEGYKTFIIAILWLVYAGLGFYLGELDTQTTMQHVFEALSIITLRLGIKKLE